MQVLQFFLPDHLGFQEFQLAPARKFSSTQDGFDKYWLIWKKLHQFPLSASPQYEKINNYEKRRMKLADY